MSFTEGDFYVRKIGRATLLKMMPDFPPKLWFSTDSDHINVYDEKAIFADPMCAGNTVLIYGARCHWGSKSGHYFTVWPQTDKAHGVINSPSPNWMRTILREVYRRAGVVVNGGTLIAEGAAIGLRNVLAYSLAANDGVFPPYLDESPFEKYKMQVLMWCTLFCDWYDSWAKRGMPMMVRYPYEGKSAKLHLQTIEGDFPDVHEYPMEVKDVQG